MLLLWQAANLDEREFATLNTSTSTATWRATSHSDTDRTSASAPRSPASRLASRGKSSWAACPSTSSPMHRGTSCPARSSDGNRFPSRLPDPARWTFARSAAAARNVSLIGLGCNSFGMKLDRADSLAVVAAMLARRVKRPGNLEIVVPPELPRGDGSPSGTTSTQQVGETGDELARREVADRHALSVRASSIGMSRRPCCRAMLSQSTRSPTCQRCSKMHRSS